MQGLYTFFMNRDPLTTISDCAGIATGIIAIVATVWVFYSQKSQKRQEFFTKLSFELILNFIKPYSDTKKRLRSTLSQKDPNERAEDLVLFLEKYPFSTRYSFWDEHKVDIYISHEQLKYIDAYNKVLEIELFIKEAKRYSEEVDSAIKNFRDAANKKPKITTVECLRNLDKDSISALMDKLNHMETSVKCLIAQQPELHIEKHLHEINQKSDEYCEY